MLYQSQSNPNLQKQWSTDGMGSSETVGPPHQCERDESFFSSPTNPYRRYGAPYHPTQWSVYNTSMDVANSNNAFSIMAAAASTSLESTSHSTAAAPLLATVPHPNQASSSSMTLPLLRKRRAAELLSDKPRRTKGSVLGWTKRFTWPDDLHRDFVSAIFDIGLKQCTASAALPMMKDRCVSTDEVERRLKIYCAFRSQLGDDCDGATTEVKGALEKPVSSKEGVGEKIDTTTAIAATSTGATANETAKAEEEWQPSAATSGDDADDMQLLTTPTTTGAFFSFPQLIEEEEMSPVGTALGNLAGMLITLSNQLQASRAKQADAGTAIAGVASTSLCQQQQPPQKRNRNRVFLARQTNPPIEAELSVDEVVWTPPPPLPISQVFRVGDDVDCDANSRKQQTTPIANSTVGCTNNSIDSVAGFGLPRRTKLPSPPTRTMTCDAAGELSDVVDDHLFESLKAYCADVSAGTDAA
jgi:hypothetical protein